jgi:ArsR family transcriptional regulator, arsenate/arsenite/antimonite-responsive transcriptional repressor
MARKIKLSDEVIQTAQIAKALSHPVRVYILKKLSGFDACCYSGDLVDELPVGRSSLSQHLKELKYAGLIQGETEPPFIKYCLNREKWQSAKTLMNLLFKENQNGMEERN